jgi:hypothetical protein
MNINTLHGASEYLLEFHGYTLEQLASLPEDSIISFAQSYYNMQLLFNNLKLN